jgi:CubicO group peptidase (beta-lactamase class C family)
LKRALAPLAFALVCLAGGARIAAAVPADETSRLERIDALFAEWNHPDSPGCALGVVEDGRLTVARGYGQASLTWRVPNGPDVVYPIGSNSKQFTAMVVLLLAEEGKLSLDDDVRKYLPELPPYSPPVRIRHLLHHTGGLRDYQALRFLSGVPPEHVVPGEVFDLIARQRGVDAPAGMKFSYDNTGYVLLRYVVERVTGERFVEVARERIFEPLGMQHTRWLEEFTTVVPNLATAYVGDPTVGFRAAYSIPVAGSGGVVTTLGDLALWQANFERNRLGKSDPALVKRELTPGTLDDGTPLDYAAGLFLSTYAGRPIVWHAGHGPGYVADIVRFPEQRLSVLCLCNGTIDSRRLSRQVADLFLPAPPPSGAQAGTDREGASPEPAAPLQHGVRLSEDELGRVAGDYLSNDNDVWAFAIESGTLVLHRGEVRMELAALAPRRFRSRQPDWGWEFTFDGDAGSRPTRVTLRDRGSNFVYTRIPDPPPPAALAPYVGRYDDPELRNPYTIALEADHLEVETSIQPRGPLLALGGDRFLLDTPFFSLVFRFTRGADGAVDGFTLDTGAADGFRFDRLSGAAY